MRKIILDQEIVESHWQRVDAEQDLPEGDILVPWPRWKEQQEAIAAHTGKVGIWLNGEDNPRELKDHLESFALLAIDFPKFADGRGYSIARILRDEMGYNGELRAIGDILRDQMFYLARCGFNAFEVRDDKELQDALEGLRDFSVTYQAASDKDVPVYRR